MAEDCIECKTTVRPRQEANLCDTCNRWQHRTCNTGISRQQYRRMVKELTLIDFKCEECSRQPQPEDVATLTPDAESTRLSMSSVASETPVTSSAELQPSTAEQSTFNLSNPAPFSIPTQIQENSLTDEVAHISQSESEAQVTFSVVDTGTQRGKRKLVSSDGFTFTFKRQNKNSVDWRCSVRNKTTTCPVVVRQEGDCFSTLNDKTHTHGALPGIKTKVEIYSQLKSDARLQLFEPAQAIVDRILEEKGDVREPETGPS